MFLNENNILLIAYIIIWLITLIIYQRRRKYFGAGSVLLVYYLSMAIVSFFLFNHPYSDGNYEDLKLFPFLYLYFMLLLASIPVLKYKEQEIVKIQQPSKLFLNIICTIIILASLFQIVSIISGFQVGLSKMLVDNSAGADLYMDTLSNYDEAGDGQIKNLPSIISNIFSDFSILLLFYYLTIKERSKFIVGGLIVAVLLSILSSIAVGLRGTTVILCFTALITFIGLRQFMMEKMRKKIKRIGVIILVLISLPIMLITISRFDTVSTEDDYAFYSMEWYYGQAFLNFNNYGIDANGIRYGDRTASLFKQIIWNDVPKNYLERRDKYSDMKIDESDFYTFVGDFTLDYGPIISLFLFIVTAIYFTYKTHIFDQTILFHQLIIVYFFMCVCVQGGMDLFTYADVGGNLKIIGFILMYFWFKIDYKLQNRDTL